MASIRPGSRSLGYLTLPYVVNGLTHKTSIRLAAAPGLITPTIGRSWASAFADRVAGVLPNSTFLASYEYRDLYGNLVFSDALDTTYPGRHSLVGGQPLYRSYTLTISGRGIPSGLDYAVGKTRIVLYVGSAFQVIAGSTKINAVGDTGLTGLYSFCLSNSDMFADFYGQKATPQPWYTTQFNAHVQQKYGT